MSESSTKNTGFSGLQVFMMVLIVMLLSIGVTSWVFYADVFSSEFKPVKLSSEEVQVLNKKLNQLGIQTSNNEQKVEPVLAPEAYTESNAKRNVVFSEKEINALLANNTDLANKLAIDLSNNLMSAKVLLPLDEEMPILGGKTLKLTAGVEMSYLNDKPVVIVKGVSVWGVPIPSAYLGDLKNVDLVKEFGDSGFWKTFADGLQNIEVKEGALHIEVKE